MIVLYRTPLAFFKSLLVTLTKFLALNLSCSHPLFNVPSIQNDNLIVIFVLGVINYWYHFGYFFSFYGDIILVSR